MPGTFQSAPPRGGRLAAVENLLDAWDVSIRAPAWGATSLASALAEPTNRSFNPRPRVGGDPPNRVHQLERRPIRVSIRAPAWGATRVLTSRTQHDSTKFQSAPPRGGRPGVGLRRLRTDQPCFNPRPRVGGDSSQQPARASWRRCQVSIRAPAWGATSFRLSGGGILEVSIRAPAWGATSVPGRGPVFHVVSIRAPAWGATRQRCVTVLRDVRSSFNPRPRVGGDRSRSAAMRVTNRCRRFQSRAPAWGATGRSSDTGRCGFERRFNPRPRVGGDHACQAVCLRRRDAFVSIRAPAWGGDSLRRAPATARCSVKFQSAPPRGGRLVAELHTRSGTSQPVSIRAPAWGATGGPGDHGRD